MNHEAETLAEALDVSPYFLNYMSYSVSLSALSKPVHDSKSGIIEAVTNGIDAFWKANLKAEKATTRKERLILEMTITESSQDHIGSYQMLRDDLRIPFKEQLASMAAEARVKYYATT